MKVKIGQLGFDFPGIYFLAICMVMVCFYFFSLQLNGTYNENFLLDVSNPDEKLKLTLTGLFVQLNARLIEEGDRWQEKSR